MRRWFRTKDHGGTIAPRADAGVIEAVRASPLFDADWYVGRYPDIAATGVDPATHYVEAGADEGRDPGPGFDTAFYMNENPDVVAARLNPLHHFIAGGRDEGRQGLPRDPVEAFEAAVRARKSGRPGIYPHALMQRVHVPVRPPPSRAAGASAMPLPTPDLAKRIGSDSLDAFDASGLDMKRAVARCLPADHGFAGTRCLDFGCGVGRMIRHFAAEAETCEFWGTDIDGSAIRWCTENLSPPFRFFQLSETPSLPFESASFDVVFAIGVLSQLYADWQHWAMEIRRVLKPGGILVMSYAGQTPFEEMMGLPYGEAEPDFGMFVVNPFASWNLGGPNTFLSQAWIKTFWGGLFDIEFIAPDALMTYHSLAVMRKSAPGPLRPKPIPVLDLATSQAFDPDATGKIDERHDRARPLRESYGIEARGPTSVTGWIVFRNDGPEGATASVDGLDLACEAAFDPSRPYRDWNARVHGFTVRLDLSGIAPGRHRLELSFRSRGRKTHALAMPLKVEAPGD